MPRKSLKAVILTALSVEFMEVRKFVSESHTVRHSSGNVYEQGGFSANGREWQIGIVETGAGDSKSALQTERAIEFFDPDVVLFVGVAGGLKDVGIGDVVASTKVYGYESGKAEEEFKPRPEIGLSGFRFIEEAKAEARGDNPAWLTRLQSEPETAPKLKVGPIAVGEKVVASTQSPVYRFLRQNYSDALAVEMEGYGFLEAVNARSKPIPAIVIRGISDLIDNKNDDQNQEPEEIRQQQAAHHAGALAFQLLSAYNPDQGITAGMDVYKPTVEARFWDDLFSCFQAPDFEFLKRVFDQVLSESNLDYSLGQVDTLSSLKSALIRLDRQDVGLIWSQRIFEHVNTRNLDQESLLVNPSKFIAWYELHQPSEHESSEERVPGYLLVTLDPVDDGDLVFLGVELNVQGQTLNSDFLPAGTKCSIDDVGDLLSDVIPQAGEVIAVEVFVSWQHFMKPVHTMEIRVGRRPRGRHKTKALWRVPRATNIRSLDRLKDEQWSEEWLKGLKERCVKLTNLEQLLPDQHICLCAGASDNLLEGALDKKFLFKSLVTLPEDEDKLADLIFELIETKVPIWAWIYGPSENSPDFSKRVDDLLKLENMKESTKLARMILEDRSNLLELGLLFDSHTRIPRLPTLAVNQSGLLRQPAA